MDGARPAYVTAVSRSDVADGWRERRRDGGIVVDVASGEIVASGLSMPHSPRLHDGRLWLLNSGRGELGTVDPASGAFTAVAFCPGYARGLAFAGRHAIVGLSRPRNNQTFEGLELDERLAAKDAAPRCGLLIVDVDTGADHRVAALRAHDRRALRRRNPARRRPGRGHRLPRRGYRARRDRGASPRLKSLRLK